MGRPKRRLYFQLCLALGVLHPDFLLEQLDSRQIAEWEAYYNLCPFGDRREDFRAAYVSLTTAQCHSPKKRLKLSDFVLPEMVRTQPQSPAEMKANLFAWARAANPQNKAGIKVKEKPKG
jgi:hypothetical protein